MQINPAPAATSPSWFLVAFDGDMVVKLFDTISIGESQSGELTLNPTPEERRIRLEVVHRELCLQVSSPDRVLSEGELPSTRQLVFDESTTVRLNFPHTSLIITPNFVAGQEASVDREINCVSNSSTSSPAIALQRLTEPVTLIDLREEVPDEPVDLDGPLPDDIIDLLNAASEDASELIPGYQSDIPDEVAPESPRAESPGETTAELKLAISQLPDTTQPELPLGSEPAPFEPRRLTAITAVVTSVGSDQEPASLSTRSDERSSNSRTRSDKPGTYGPSAGRRATRMVLLTAAACGALLLPVFLSDSDILPIPMEEPVTAGTELPMPASEPVAVEREAEAAAATENAVATSEVKQATPETETLFDDAARPRNIADPAQTATIATLLAEARTLYEADSIVSPIQRNAVKVLTEILTIDPTNAEGLDLMYLSATRLLTLAKVAHEAGENFQARNLVEEVLGFHPEFEDAHALLRSWAAAESTETEESYPAERQ